MAEFDDPYAATVRPRRSLRNTALLMLVAAVLTAAVLIWAVTRWAPARNLIVPPPIAAASAAQSTLSPTRSPQPLATMPTTTSAPDFAGTEARVAGIEARIAQVDQQAATAAANAARAEGLLIAFAARRSVDSGRPLGYIEGQLRARFAATQPRAVAAVITASQAPVTLDTLRRDLDAIAPDLVGGGAAETWSETLRRAGRALIVVRRKDEPSPLADARLARAQQAIDGAQVDVALAEIARLPARAKAAAWIAAARRHVEAHRALDILEAAALTSPAGAPEASFSSTTGGQ